MQLRIVTVFCLVEPVPRLCDTSFSDRGRRPVSKKYAKHARNSGVFQSLSCELVLRHSRPSSQVQRCPCGLGPELNLRELRTSVKDAANRPIRWNRGSACGATSLNKPKIQRLDGVYLLYLCPSA